MATAALPKWIMQRYSVLWRTFKIKDFDFEKAGKALKLKNHILLSQILSELKKAGWLKIKLDPKDSRKRIYTLKNPEEAVKELAHA